MDIPTEIMELDLSSQEGYFLNRRVFNLKTHRSDGLVLQVHNSHSDSAGEKIIHRFINASFNYHGTHLAVSDHKSNIFIISLELERYWQLPQIGVPTVISFPVLRTQELLIGLDNTSVVFVDIETGDITGILHGHSVPATEVSYSDDGYYYLTSCSAEAIVWDSSTYVQVHRLSLKEEVYLKKVLFMPVTNHILACFQDDTVHIWKFGTFECIKRIVPETWKNYNLTSIAITKNGRTMVIGGKSPNLVVFCLDSWGLKNVIEFPDSISGVRQLEFLSQVFDGGANKILVVLTISKELFFFDVETLVFLKWIHQINGLTDKFSLSCNGKYLSSTLATGEVNIYTIEKVLCNQRPTPNIEEGQSFNQTSGNRIYSSSSKRTQKTYESLSSIQREIKEVLDVKKLLPILKQFGEYPQSYRTLIWKTILQLPENQECFVSLSMKKCHPSYSKVEVKYPLANKSLCNSLKKLLSNLAHWCPLFGEVDFLPEFVFPFVKLFHSSPLICFEVTATVIVNWCQNWFEFYPFPPVNLLSLLESILGYHDPELLEFYFMNNVTSSVSFCPLYHTAFSEVLSKNEWLKLWDHVLSNEASFLFMAIIAYNVICRNAVRSLKNTSEIEKFFHTQNPVDMKMLISKAYQYLKETPEDIHTRQFLAPFRSLGSLGTYNKFLAYPKLIFDTGTEKLQTIRKAEERILEEQFRALSIKKALEEKLTQNNAAEDKDKIYQELEEKIRNTVEEEEDRLLLERQKLQNLRQELKLKELEVLEKTRDKALQKKIKQKELEFERLLKDISKRKHREKVEVDTMEREIRNYYSDLLLRRCQLEVELGLKDSESVPEESLRANREKLRNDLAELQYEWDNCYRSNRIDICNKLTAIKGLICDVEMEISKETAEKNTEKHLENDRVFVDELKRKVNLLEDEVKKLLKNNLEKLREKEQTISVNSRLPAKSGLLRKQEKVMIANHDVKNNGNTKSRKPVKCVTTKISPGSRSDIRRITKFRTRVPKTKLRDSGNDKHSTELSADYWESLVNMTACKISSRSQSPHQRSKFTQPTKSPHFKLSFPKHTEDFDQPNTSEKHEMKTSHQRPIGDCPSEKKLFMVHRSSINKKIENPSNSKVEKGDPLNNSADEIFKSALNTRSQIIEEAKRRQRLQ